MQTKASRRDFLGPYPMIVSAPSFRKSAAVASPTAVIKTASSRQMAINAPQGKPGASIFTRLRDRGPR
jgi:hypothetical protein